MEQIQYVMKSPIRPLYLVASKEGLDGVYFTKQNVKTVKTLNSRIPQEQTLLKTSQQLDEFFAGRRKQFDIVLNLAGTTFQKQVWGELKKIPFGQTVSYKDIARRIKNPKAVRAVGSANGKNPACIIIPCHRVIAADGSIGGYGGGISTKEKLLKLEQQVKRI